MDQTSIPENTRVHTVTQSFVDQNNQPRLFSYRVDAHTGTAIMSENQMITYENKLLPDPIFGRQTMDNSDDDEDEYYIESPRASPFAPSPVSPSSPPLPPIMEEDDNGDETDLYITPPPSNPRLQSRRLVCPHAPLRGQRRRKPQTTTTVRRRLDFGRPEPIECKIPLVGSMRARRIVHAAINREKHTYTMKLGPAESIHLTTPLKLMKGCHISNEDTEEEEDMD